MGLADIARREAYRQLGRGLKRSISSIERKIFGPSAKRARAGRPLPDPSGGTGRYAAPSGYSLHRMKARNVKRRRRFSKKRKIRSARRNKIRSAGIAGKLMSKIYKRMMMINELEQNARGNVALLNLRNGYLGVNRHLLPLHIYDLTDVHFDQTSRSVGLQLFHDWGLAVTTKNYFFHQSVPQKANPDGETGGNQYNLLTPAVSNVAYTDIRTADLNTVRKAYQHDVNIELMMYGQEKLDTMYRVDVVMFDPQFVEWMYSDDGQNDSNHRPTIAEWNQFWHTLVMPYTQNPLAKRARGKYMKILKTYKFHIPEQSGDYEQAQCVKTRIKIPMNRIRDRYWKHPSAPSAIGYAPEDAAHLNSEAYDSISSTEYGGGYIHPKNRVFLMIRASNPEMGENADGDISIAKGADPTYDITMKTSFTVNV